MTKRVSRDASLHESTVIAASEHAGAKPRRARRTPVVVPLFHVKVNPLIWNHPVVKSAPASHVEVCGPDVVIVHNNAKWRESSSAD